MTDQGMPDGRNGPEDGTHPGPPDHAEECPDEWSPEDEILAEALAYGMSHAAAGRLIGRSSKTVQRRLRDSSFARYVSEKRADRVRDLTTRLVGLADDALEVFAELLHDPDVSAKLRFEAAKYLADAGPRLHRTQVIEEDLAARMEALERAGSLGPGVLDTSRGMA